MKPKSPPASVWILWDHEHPGRKIDFTSAEPKCSALYDRYNHILAPRPSRIAKLERAVVELLTIIDHLARPNERDEKRGRTMESPMRWDGGESWAKWDKRINRAVKRARLELARRATRRKPAGKRRGHGR